MHFLFLIFPWKTIIPISSKHAKTNSSDAGEYQGTAGNSGEQHVVIGIFRKKFLFPQVQTHYYLSHNCTSSAFIRNGCTSIEWKGQKSNKSADFNMHILLFYILVNQIFYCTLNSAGHLTVWGTSYRSLWLNIPDLKWVKLKYHWLDKFIGKKGQNLISWDLFTKKILWSLEKW